MSDYKVTVLGAGLAGCEAALWLAGKGVQVDLYEQKPMHFSPAHKSEGFAELICSNSLKAERLDSASGLLKEEMRRMGSQLLEAAEEARVAAGGALAVDRDAFSAAVTRRVEECPNITVVREQVEHIDESAPILVATGPLTDGALADEIGRLTGDERLHFYDAVAPIVTAESLDYDRVFAASRYDRGEADYLNCPFNKAEYEAFHAALASAERAPLHDFDAGAEQGAAPDPDAHGKRPTPSRSTRAVCPSRSWRPAVPTPCGSARCARWVWWTPTPATAPGPTSSCGPRTRSAPCTTSWASRPTSSGASRSGCSA